MPIPPGFRRTRKKRNKPLARSLPVVRILGNIRIRFPASSVNSNKRLRDKLPNGQLWDFAGVGRYDTPCTLSGT